MIKNLTQIEVNIDNKICRLIVDQDTPLTHIKEALFQFQKYIGQIEDAAKKQQEEEKLSKIEELNEEKPEQVI
jgi:hypothetical protein